MSEPLTHHRTRPHRRPGLLAGLVAASILVGPGSALASTSSEPPPAACDVPASVVAGRPLELTGTTTDPAEMVGILARKDTGESREGSVAIVEGRWRGVVVFGAADAGSWTIDVTVDGKDCVSPLTVTLPPGVVAPPTRQPVEVSELETPTGGIDAGSIRSSAAIGGGLVVLASWALLAIIALMRLLGRQPFADPRLGGIARVATFVAILGAFTFAGLFVYFMASLSHFDTGLPPTEAAILDVGMWLVVAVGSAVGAIVARRVPGGDRHAG